MARWLRHIMMLGIITIFALLAISAAIYTHFNRDLPDHHQLAEYYPATMSRIYASDYTVLAELALQKRIVMPIEKIPLVVKQAFIAAEDRNFYKHSGIDLVGIIRAAWNNATQKTNLQGASTITQQVAKNILLSRERTFSRKIKEIILSLRISKTFTKEEVLELYLNDIYLGASSYGVVMAARHYFNKELSELTVEEAALLAALPKAPSSLNPWNNYDGALVRRNWVISAMVEEGFITETEGKHVQAQGINLQAPPVSSSPPAPFFSEEVRQELVQKFGYGKTMEEGLSVYATLDPVLQDMAEWALRRGLVRYTRRHGYRGSYANISIEGDWLEALQEVIPPVGIGDWKLAVVLKIDAEKEQVDIGLQDGSISYVTFRGLQWVTRSNPPIMEINPETGEEEAVVLPPEEVFTPGEVVLVEKLEGQASPYGVRQMPQVNGALVAMDPHTGRVKAMVGGYDFTLSKFNRVTQAKRQPGSAFKPIVYLAAMEQGLTPADRIADEPIEFVTPEENAILSVWAPQNHSGKFYGATTLRTGLEKSLNVLTVHLGTKVGIGAVISTAKKLGIDAEYVHNMTTVLGAAETTLLDLVAAYGIIANGGHYIEPVLIDRVQDRQGQLIWESGVVSCEGCDNPEAVPVVRQQSEQMIQASSAYQLTSMLQGVVERGTGKRAQAISKPVAGKTGTTDQSRDAWFVGFGPDLVVGVFVGFDTPKSLGKYEEGSSVALPIFVDFMKEALADKPSKPFPIPEGVKLVAIDRKTGYLPSEETPKQDIILEAFKAGSEPTKSISRSATLPVINPRSSRHQISPVDTNAEEVEVPKIHGTGGIY